MNRFVFVTPKVVPPFLKHFYEDRIQPLADDFNKRIALFRCNPERGSQQDDENGLVLPAVEFPLMLPKPDWMAKQRLGVADRPQIANGRATRANQVAKQMKVECKQAQKQNPPFLPRP